MTLVPGQLRRVGNHATGPTQVALDSLKGKRLHAVAGIGNPERFFEMLGAMGLDAKGHAFPDHHAYKTADLEFPDCDAVLMTEKDAVKCRHFGRADLYALEVDAEVDPALIELIMKRIHGRPPS